MNSTYLIFTVWYVPEFNCTLSHHIEFSHPAQRAVIDLKRNADRPVWKNLLENAASWHAAAAKKPPFLSQSARGKTRVRSLPGALYPHPVPNQNAQKCLDGRVWWVLIEQSRPKIFGNFTTISTKFKYPTKFLLSKIYLHVQGPSLGPACTCN